MKPVNHMERITLSPKYSCDQRYATNVALVDAVSEPRLSSIRVTRLFVECKGPFPSLETSVAGNRNVEAGDCVDHTDGSLGASCPRSQSLCLPFQSSCIALAESLHANVPMRETRTISLNASNYSLDHGMSGSPPQLAPKVAGERGLPRGKGALETWFEGPISYFSSADLLCTL